MMPAPPPPPPEPNPPRPDAELFDQLRQTRSAKKEKRKYATAPRSWQSEDTPRDQEMKDRAFWFGLQIVFAVIAGLCYVAMTSVGISETPAAIVAIPLGVVGAAGMYFFLTRHSKDD